MDRILAGSEDGAEKLGMHQQEDDEISLPSLGDMGSSTTAKAPSPWNSNRPTPGDMVHEPLVLCEVDCAGSSRTD